MRLGDKLGLYKALREGGPMTSSELAAKCQLAERYVREWAANQAASGYLEYDPAARAFALPEEHAMVLTDPDSPAYMLPGFEMPAIFAENERALATLTAGRAGLPAYHPLGCLNCSGINIGRTKRPFEARCDIERGSLALLPQIVECLNRNNARKQFAPFHTCEEFLLGKRWRDFRVSDFYVAIRSGRVDGVIGQWNQRRFKGSAGT